MQFNTFEEKVAAFGLEQGWIPKEPKVVGAEEYTFFSVTVHTGYKGKFLQFCTHCENVDIRFDVIATTLDEMFDKAWRAVKAMNRICNPLASKAKEEVGE